MTEESGSGNRWEPVGAPPPEIPPVVQGTERPAPRRRRREKGVLAGMAAALLFGGGAVGFTGAKLAGPSTDDQPGQPQDVRPVPARGWLQPPPGSVRDDGGYASGEDET